jgi:hypothetical protein
MYNKGKYNKYLLFFILSKLFYNYDFAKQENY